MGNHSIASTLKEMATQARSLPMKNGEIAIMIGDQKSHHLCFTIPASVVIAAAEAGIKYAEELKAKGIDGTEANTQSVGGE